VGREDDAAGDAKRDWGEGLKAHGERQWSKKKGREGKKNFVKYGGERNKGKYQHSVTGECGDIGGDGPGSGEE